MTLIDEYTRKCLNIGVARQLTSKDVLADLGEAIEKEGVPSYICSDNGSEFIAHQVQQWLSHKNIKTIWQSLATERSDTSTSQSENNKRFHRVVSQPLTR